MKTVRAFILFLIISSSILFPSFSFGGEKLSLYKSSAFGKPRRIKGLVGEKMPDYLSLGLKYRYYPPMFAFLGIYGNDFENLFSSYKRIFEFSLTKEIQKGRFYYVKFPVKLKFINEVTLNFLTQKLVKVFAEKSFGIAKMRAAWNSQFQGYEVTSDLLHSIQNPSYFYWIRVKKFRWDGPRNGFYIELEFYLYKMHIFPCTERYTKEGEKFFRACRGKSPKDYAGFSELFIKQSFKSYCPFQRRRGGEPSPEYCPLVDLSKYQLNKVYSAVSKIIKIALLFGGGVNSSKASNYALGPTAQINTKVLSPKKWVAIQGQFLGKKIYKSLIKYRRFRLFTPVMYSTLSHVYFDLGRAEDLKPNTGFDVYIKKVSGGFLYRGYVRVREIGDNRFKIVNGRRVRVNPKAPYLSKAQILATSGTFKLMKGMVLFERPKKGFNFLFGGGLLPIRSPNLSEVAPAIPFPASSNIGLAPSLRFGVHKDISSTGFWSELYFSTYLEMAFLADSQGFIFPLVLATGIDKRFYIFRRLCIPFYTSLISMLSFSSSFQVYAGGEIGTGLELFINPEWSLRLDASFRALVGLLNSSELSRPFILAPSINFIVYYSF